MTSVAEDMAARGVAMTQPATANLLVAFGISPRRSWLGWDALTCPSIYGAVSGVVWWTIDQRFGQGQRLEPNPVRDASVQDAYSAIKNGAQVPSPLLSDFRSYLYINNADFLDWTPATDHGTQELDRIIDELAVYTMCALHEGGEETESLLIKLRPFYRGSIQAAFTCATSDPVRHASKEATGRACPPLHRSFTSMAQTLARGTCIGRSPPRLSTPRFPRK
ncbi:hypothetical protein [Rhodococcus erythropolis]|uniref:hypothetical protein n=1 Tax=Rhodococcus erythropolis TaxID=1833 RepID=UPI0030138329